MSSHCPLCQADQPLKVVENSQYGTFYECVHCHVHYAATADFDLERYYREIWAEGNLGFQGYEEKVKAATDRDGPGHLIQEIPRYSWVVRQFEPFEVGSKILDVGCGEGGLLWAAQDSGWSPTGATFLPGPSTWHDG